MEDQKIIELYLNRDETAINETDKKYGKMLMAMAIRILSDENDGQECVNDTYFKAWNSIPPTVPTYFSAFLHKIVRSLSIDRLRSKQAQCRKASEYALSLEELSECISSQNSPHETMETQLLKESIERYLLTLKKDHRQMFLCRYYFTDSVKTIADYFACGEGKVKSTLFRVRSGLKEYLRTEGFLL